MYDIKEKNWYVIQTFSGCENKVVKEIQKQIKINNFQNLFGQIMVPGEKLIEIKSGKKKKSECKFFPGYILVNMHINEKSWYLINNIPKVIKFIGNLSDKPTPIDILEIENIKVKVKKLGSYPRPKVLFAPGEKVRVKKGPFAEFKGIVEEVDYIKHRLKVSVLIFGRSTPVELSFSQIEKHIS